MADSPIHGLRWRAGRLSTVLLLILVALFSEQLSARGNWYVNSSIGMGKGKFIYDKTSFRYNWKFGGRYNNGRLSFLFSIPVVFQNTDLMTQSAGMLLPANHSSGENAHTGNRHGGNLVSTSTGHLQTGIGDINLYSEYRLFDEGENMPAVSVSGQVKFPTASRISNFGTGQLDFGAGLLLRKQYGTYALFGDVTWLNLGDPDLVNYDNPVYWGVGAGKFLGSGRYGLSIYYSQSTEIIKGFEGFKELSAGAYYTWGGKTFSAEGGIGLSDTTPDLSFSIGIETAL